MSAATIADIRSQERCSECPIRHRAVCSYSTPVQLNELDAIKFYTDNDPGRELVAAGELTQSLGSIVSGVAVMHKTMEDGRRQIVGLMFPGDFIGRPFRKRAPYDVEAVTPVRLCLFRRSQFESLLSASPQLERRLLEMTLDELDAARDWMLLLGRKTAREKVASFLVLLAKRAALPEGGAVGDGLSFHIPLSRDLIAEYLGLTIETVSRQMTALRKEGIIALPDARTVELRDHLALLEAGGDGDELGGEWVDSA